MIVPIDSVVPNQWNPNKQSEYIFEKELTSIKTHGMVQSILVRQKGTQLEIMDGEHRWRAAKQLGFTEISVNNMGEISDQVAQQLTIIMNEVKGKADDQLMAKLVASLAQGIDLAELEKNLPYTKNELEHFIANAKIDWDAISSEMPVVPEPEKSDEVTFSVKLLTTQHADLRAQIDRLKNLLYPNRDDINDDLIFISIIKIISQTNDMEVMKLLS